VATGRRVTGIESIPDGLLVSTDGDDTGTGTDDRVADRVVSSAPPSYTERELLPSGRRDHEPGYWESRTYGPAAFLLYLGVEGTLEEFEHHTLVLPTDWRGHFEAIFEYPVWPADPAYHVNVPSRTDEGVAPNGHGSVVTLVPIEPNGCLTQRS
jgi:phytoene desaturase